MRTSARPPLTSPDSRVHGIVRLILKTHPATQAIYRYGTWATAAHRVDSDLDVALLLPHGEAMRVDRWQRHLLAVRLAGAAGIEHADLVNLRRADTTLQAEILGMRPIRSRSSESDAQAWRVLSCRTTSGVLSIPDRGVWLVMVLRKP